MKIINLLLSLLCLSVSAVLILRGIYDATYRGLWVSIVGIVGLVASAIYFSIAVDRASK